jgi:hypothetical protein
LGKMLRTFQGWNASKERRTTRRREEGIAWRSAGQFVW